MCRPDRLRNSVLGAAAEDPKMAAQRDERWQLWMQLHGDGKCAVSVMADAVLRDRRADAGREVSEGNDLAAVVEHVTDVGERDPGERGQNPACCQSQFRGRF